MSTRARKILAKSVLAVGYAIDRSLSLVIGIALTAKLAAKELKANNRQEAEDVKQVVDDQGPAPGRKDVD